ncbi:uncharacterized protein LOC133784817 [Humulus lupulus]|uniref:uncharacterized protein LOC133784817 n=1 Tax=Humulus lupulus TaxID=3486 RepID=UPI002B41511B|nr:uncharacterized protein LOC133784817 [Humulus lupulus]
MAMNNYQWPSERDRNKKVAGMHELDVITTLTAQVALLTKKLQQNSMATQVMQIQAVCHNYGGPHPFEQFMVVEMNNSIPMEQLNMMGNFKRNLEMQVGQLANMLQSRPQGNLPSNTEVNPKEQCNAISLRSGKKLEESVKKSIPAPKVDVENEGKVEEEVIEDLEKKQSPEKLPPKLKDLGSFSIPCSIGDSVMTKALYDLGASINLMPLSVFKRLKLGEARPTTVTLQLVDRSIAHPRGIIEDVLVKVDKFIFPADFIVLDMEEDANVPIILGRLFLSTSRASIDVQKGELKLRVQKEKVTFNVFAAADVPTCCRVDVVESKGNKLEVTKKKSMVEGGKRIVHQKVKRMFVRKFD